MSQQNHLEAFGDEEIDDAGSDFASEHSDTTVDKDITAGRDKGESESPDGWDGMDQDGTP
jgi:hypothetical protein